MNHLLSIRDLDRKHVLDIFKLTAELKAKVKAGERVTPLAGRTLALIFEKPSLRTRVTFEVAMVQLGGAAVYSLQIVLLERYAPRFDPPAFTLVEMAAAFCGLLVGG